MMLTRKDPSSFWQKKKKKLQTWNFLQPFPHIVHKKGGGAHLGFPEKEAFNYFHVLDRGELGTPPGLSQK